MILQSDTQNMDDMLVFFEKERKRVISNGRRARKARVRCNLKPGEWFVRLIQFGFKCAYCQQPFETLDHIVSISCGGGTTFSNVVPCCRDCNLRKGTAVWLPACASSVFVTS